MTLMNFNCRKCAKCCNTFPIDVGHTDIIRWDLESRRDILQQVSFINNYPKKGYAGFYIEQTLRNPKQPCPFLKDSLCSIYETRPMVCKDFPLSHDGDVCEYLEVRLSQEDRADIQTRQEEDLRRALQYYNGLMAILVEARH